MDYLQTIYNSPEGKAITFLKGIGWQQKLELMIKLLDVSSVLEVDGIIFLKTPVNIVSYEPITGIVTLTNLELDNNKDDQEFNWSDSKQVIKDLCFYIKLFQMGKVERYGWKVILPTHRS